MEKEDQEFIRKQRDFHTNPGRNPDTGGILRYGMRPYLSFVEKYGLPPHQQSTISKIQSPKVPISKIQSPKVPISKIPISKLPISKLPISKIQSPKRENLGLLPQQFDPIDVNIILSIDDMETLYKLWTIDKDRFGILLNNPYILNQLAPNFKLKGPFNNFSDFYKKYKYKLERAYRDTLYYYLSDSYYLDNNMNQIII